MQYYNLFDLFLVPAYFLIALFIATYIKNRYKKDIVYKYLVPGIVAKMLGAIAICFVYTHYYGYGGDTIAYHNTSFTLINLLYLNPGQFFEVILSNPTRETFSYFTIETGYPPFWADIYSFNVARFIVPLEFISFRSFAGTALLMGVLSFTGVWKLYKLFCTLYPQLYKQFAISILFIPSVLFWGSGILKDTITLAAACWYCYAFYGVFIARKSVFVNVVSLCIAIFVMVSVKPYIFVALLPGSILWSIWGRLMKIKNGFIRIVIGPVIISMGLGLGVGIWLFISPFLGRYSTLDSMIAKAAESQEDLKREYYQGNSFDIGSFEKTPIGVLKKFPLATMAGLFRPYIWEARNPQMVISGLENLFLLLFTIFFLIRMPTSFIKQIISNPHVLFCILFSVIFAFSVGLSTSNFGALVRFKIPLLPFFLSALFIVNYHRLLLNLRK